MLPEVTQGISGTEKKIHTESETGGGGPGRSSEGAPMREEVARSQERSAFQELRAHVWICQGWGTVTWTRVVRCLVGVKPWLTWWRRGWGRGSGVRTGSYTVTGSGHRPWGEELRGLREGGTSPLGQPSPTHRSLQGGEHPFPSPPPSISG